MLDYTTTSSKLSQIGHKVYSLRADEFINAEKFSSMLDSMLEELAEQWENNEEDQDAVDRLAWLNKEVDKLILILNGIITSRKVWETMRF